MKIKIYRGTKEIGGTCVELMAANGKVLWIDLGAPLSLENPDVSYQTNKVDALLISHSHQDHYGLMESVGSEVPIYIGQVSKELIEATRIFLGKPTPNCNFKEIGAWKEFEVADTFNVFPYLVDHSSPEAFAFLIECDGMRVFYSGDFRSTGRKRICFEKMIKNPPKNIDLLLIEGTMINRDKQDYATELILEEELVKRIKEQENATFVISSAQNIDRFCSVFNACRLNNKTLIIDIYNAWVLDVVRKKSPGLPTMDSKIVKVYAHPNQMQKISDLGYTEFIDRININAIGNGIFKNPSDFVYFLRCPSTKLIDALRPTGRIKMVYSQWKGYLEPEHKTYCTDTIKEWINQKKVDFEVIHTGGHATIEDLIILSKAINPKKTIPIHTDNPAKMRTELEAAGVCNVELGVDGESFQL
ncbi:MAG: MBL fold metallo-hydrolase [bacterium]